MNELALLRAMQADLEEYLLSGTVFWQLTGPSDFPKLSLGYLFLTRARLKAVTAQLSPVEQIELAQLERAIESSLSQKPVAAEKKAESELRQRVNLWARFLDDCAEDKRTCAEDYPREVTQRVIATLLVTQFPRVSAGPEALRLPPLDARLRGRLTPGVFLWPAELQGAFPEKDFWFLYGRL